VTNSETRDTITGLFNQDTLANFSYEYNAQIYSIYAIWGQELGKFKYQIGVRGEYAQQIPYLISTGEKYKNDYLNLFPSAHLKYDLSKSSQFSLSYSRRINRASSRQLNPFTSYADPLNLRSGNPELQPEYIDSYDLGYSFNKKKINLSFSVFHKRTRDVINRIKVYYPDNTAIVTYANIDKSESTGFESVIVYKPFKWLRNTLSFNGNYIDYTNSDETVNWNNDGFNWGAKYILTVDFWKKTMSAQLNAKYNAPRVTPQGIVQPRTGIDVSVEKRLFDNRFSIGARVTDIFNTKGFELELMQDGVRQVSEYKWLTRRFYITLSYKIGKYDNQKSSRGSAGGDGF
jgi:outer membrane receptor protein involved in Fe transport